MVYTAQQEVPRDTYVAIGAAPGGRGSGGRPRRSGPVRLGRRHLRGRRALRVALLDPRRLHSPCRSCSWGSAPSYQMRRAWYDKRKLVEHGRLGPLGRDAPARPRSIPPPTEALPVRGLGCQVPAGRGRTRSTASRTSLEHVGAIVEPVGVIGWCRSRSRARSRSAARCSAPGPSRPDSFHDRTRSSRTANSPFFVNSRAREVGPHDCGEVRVVTAGPELPEDVARVPERPSVRWTASVARPKPPPASPPPMPTTPAGTGSRSGWRWRARPRRSRSIRRRARASTP